MTVTFTGTHAHSLVRHSCHFTYMTVMTSHAGTQTHQEHKASQGKSDSTGSGAHGSHSAIAGSALKTKVKGLIPGKALIMDSDIVPVFV